jgi:hypothetical protein
MFGIYEEQKEFYVISFFSLELKNNSVFYYLTIKCFSDFISENVCFAEIKHKCKIA